MGGGVIIQPFLEIKNKTLFIYIIRYMVKIMTECFVLSNKFRTELANNIINY